MRFQFISAANARKPCLKIRKRCGFYLTIVAKTCRKAFKRPRAPSRSNDHPTRELIAVLATTARIGGDRNSRPGASACRRPEHGRAHAPASKAQGVIRGFRRAARSARGVGYTLQAICAREGRCRASCHLVEEEIPAHPPSSSNCEQGDGPTDCFICRLFPAHRSNNSTRSCRKSRMRGRDEHGAIVKNRRPVAAQACRPVAVSGNAPRGSGHSPYKERYTGEANTTPGENAMPEHRPRTGTFSRRASPDRRTGRRSPSLHSRRRNSTGEPWDTPELSAMLHDIAGNRQAMTKTADGVDDMDDENAAVLAEPAVGLHRRNDGPDRRPARNGHAAMEAEAMEGGPKR